MTCGCKTDENGSERISVFPGFPLPIIQTRAGMCLSCHYAPPDGGVEGACGLAPTGPALLRAAQDQAQTCPLGRWPDEGGIVRWHGSRWFGVPDPLRWVVLRRLGREGKLPGCGCSVGLKASKAGRWLDPWMRISAELRGRVADALSGWRECQAGFNGTG